MQCVMDQSGIAVAGATGLAEQRSDSLPIFPAKTPPLPPPTR